jgi:hypothetical protein
VKNEVCHGEAGLSLLSYDSMLRTTPWRAGNKWKVFTTFIFYRAKPNHLAITPA